MKKFSPSLTIQEMQIKTTLRIHLQSEWLSLKTQTTTNGGEDVGKRNSYT
jgi:hypothetical protein